MSHPLVCEIFPRPSGSREIFFPGLLHEPPELPVLLAHLFPQLATALATTTLTVNDVAQHIVELGPAEWENEIDRTIGGVQYHGHPLCALFDALTVAFLAEAEDLAETEDETGSEVENHVQYLLNHLQELHVIVVSRYDAPNPWPLSLEAALSSQHELRRDAHLSAPDGVFPL